MTLVSDLAVPYRNQSRQQAFDHFFYPGKHFARYRVQGNLILLYKWIENLLRAAISASMDDINILVAENKPPNCSWHNRCTFRGVCNPFCEDKEACPCWHPGTLESGFFHFLFCFKIIWCSLDKSRSIESDAQSTGSCLCSCSRFRSIG